MSTKADAFAALDSRLAQLDFGRAFRSSARIEAHRVAVGFLEALWLRLRPVAHVPMALFADKLRADLESSLNDLGETLSGDVLADLVPPPLGVFEDEVERSIRLVEATPLVDRLGLTNRSRIERSVRAEFDAKLSRGAQHVATRLVDYYDTTTDTLQSRFSERMDSIESALLRAGAFAEKACSDGPNGLAQARSWLLQSSLALSEVVDALP